MSQFATVVLISIPETTLIFTICLHRNMLKEYLEHLSESYKFYLIVSDKWSFYFLLSYSILTNLSEFPTCYNLIMVFTFTNKSKGQTILINMSLILNDFPITVSFTIYSM